MASIGFIDTSLRDGHQSLLATRMSTEQCMRVLPLVKETGYRIIELWGGATLDACLRFTGDDPFARLDAFRELLGPAGSGAQIRSLCRGQNLFGYTPYADGVVFSFMKEAVRSGNDRVRVFDALNDTRNLQTAVMSVKTFNGHAEAALSYTTSPVHDEAYFVRFAHTAVDNGADSVAIKDMAGLLHPADCFSLVEALRSKLGDVPITLHSHGTNGLATTAYIAGMLAGVDYLDTAHGPMANATSQPSVELLTWVAEAAGIEHNVDRRHFGEIDGRLRTIRQELESLDKDPEHFGEPWPDECPADVRKKIDRVLELVGSKDRDKIDEAIAIVEDEILVPQGFAPVDRTQLDAQVPGGMISNLHNQLKDQGQLDQMPKILDEIPRVREEAGFVPLVTPTSQIVGSQAAMNVITGERYKVISNEFRSMVLGKYGRLPGEPSEEVVLKCSPDGERFDKRPGDYAPEPSLAGITPEVSKLLKTPRDQLLYTLFPVPATKFFESRAT
ncbi:MAG: oxaloacetate decarboxylase subunit alpha [Planctomycetota bacterium]